MTTLQSKIAGVSLWAYDYSRQPDKNERHQTLVYTIVNKQLDSVKPLTQNPTEALNQAKNIFTIFCNVNKYFNGNNLQTHGIKYKPSDNIDQLIKTHQFYSVSSYYNAIFSGDDIYIQNPDKSEVTNNASKTPFTTKSQGVKIIDQTGIISINRGYGYLIFEIEQGYKIPVGSNIQIISTYNKEDDNTGMDYSVTEPTENYKVSYDLQPGIYGIAITDTVQAVAANINFATVKDITAPKPEPKPTPKPEPKPTPKPKPLTIPIVTNLEHVTSDITGASINRNLNAINLTADKDYVFHSSIQVLLYSGGKVLSDYNVKGNDTNTLKITLNTTKENTITDNMDNIKLTAVATHIEQHDGYEHNYLITQNELNAFGREKIFAYIDDDRFDVSQYMNNLIELPFIVDTVTTVKNISIGRLSSQVVSHETKSQFITVDLGVINVPAKYNNGYDYQNKSIKLFTPFVSPITINNENSINNSIHIVYKVDISSGFLTVNLYNNDVLFFTGTNNIASQLPFLNSIKNTIINRNTHFNDNDIRRPYLVVTRETPILNNDYYPTIERGLIKNYNGNIKARLLNNLNISNNEFSELNNLLESGVYYVKND